MHLNYLERTEITATKIQLAKGTEQMYAKKREMSIYKKSSQSGSSTWHQAQTLC